jgi:hypothetical protein
MTCTIYTKYGKRGVTGNLKKLAVEVEHEIERGHEARHFFEAGRTYKILGYKSSSVHSFRKKYSSRENKHFKSLPVN